jgi:hypothetical protein
MNDDFKPFEPINLEPHTARELRALMRTLNAMEPCKSCATSSGGFTRTGIWLDLILGKKEKRP